MSKYTHFYSSSDVSIFLESSIPSKVNYPIIQLDKASSIGWSERIITNRFYGIGNPEMGFSNSGNLAVDGFLEINFTHEEYLLKSLRAVQGEEAEEVSDEDFFALSPEQVSEGLAKFSRINEKNSSSGILSFPSRWNLRIVFNNGNLYHDDKSKVIILEDCRIIERTNNSSSSHDGSIKEGYKLLAKRVR